MEDQNPCNCCVNHDRCDLNNNCVFGGLGDSYCTNSDCMLHYEDSCLVGLADKCGSNPDATIEWDDEEEEEE